MQDLKNPSAEVREIIGLSAGDKVPINYKG